MLDGGKEVAGEVEGAGDGDEAARSCELTRCVKGVARVAEGLAAAGKTPKRHGVGGARVVRRRKKERVGGTGDRLDVRGDVLVGGGPEDERGAPRAERPGDVGGERPERDRVVRDVEEDGRLAGEELEPPGDLELRSLAPPGLRKRRRRV